MSLKEENDVLENERNDLVIESHKSDIELKEKKEYTIKNESKEINENDLKTNIFFEYLSLCIMGMSTVLLYNYILNITPHVHELLNKNIDVSGMFTLYFSIFVFLSVFISFFIEVNLILYEINCIISCILQITFPFITKYYYNNIFVYKLFICLVAISSSFLKPMIYSIATIIQNSAKTISLSYGITGIYSFVLTLIFFYGIMNIENDIEKFQKSMFATAFINTVFFILSIILYYIMKRTQKFNYKFNIYYEQKKKLKSTKNIDYFEKKNSINDNLKNNNTSLHNSNSIDYKTNELDNIKISNVKEDKHLKNKHFNFKLLNNIKKDNNKLEKKNSDIKKEYNKNNLDNLINNENLNNNLNNSEKCTDDYTNLEHHENIKENNINEMKEYNNIKKKSFLFKRETKTQNLDEKLFKNYVINQYQKFLKIINIKYLKNKLFIYKKARIVLFCIFYNIFLKISIFPVICPELWSQDVNMRFIFIVIIQLADCISRILPVFTQNIKMFSFLFLSPKNLFIQTLLRTFIGLICFIVPFFNNVVFNNYIFQFILIFIYMYLNGWYVVISFINIPIVLKEYNSLNYVQDVSNIGSSLLRLGLLSGLIFSKFLKYITS